jgi:hypothetical protein
VHPQAPDHPIQRKVVKPLLCSYPVFFVDIPAPYVCVHAWKPHLLRAAGVIFEPRLAPSCSLEGLSLLIDRKCLEIDFGDGGEIDVMELIALAVGTPEQWEGNAERTDRVEYAQALDPQRVTRMHVLGQPRPNTRETVIRGRSEKLRR